MATCELKNPGTGQSWRSAVKQYREDRDPRAPLFGFKMRALVHFAVDPDEVHMTTRLEGKATTFLPFNKGHNDVKLTRDQIRRIKCWTDLNCPLWPDYVYRPLRPGPQVARKGK